MLPGCILLQNKFIPAIRYLLIMEIFDNNFREIFLSQIISMVGGLLAGLVLVSYKNELILIPGLFIIIPGFLEMRGAISGSFASRLSAGLFLGVIDPAKTATRLIRSNIAASFLLALVVSFALGLLAFVFTYIVTGVLFPKIILIAVLAAIAANAIEMPLALSRLRHPHLSRAESHSGRSADLRHDVMATAQ